MGLFVYLLTLVTLIHLGSKFMQAQNFKEAVSCFGPAVCVFAAYIIYTRERLKAKAKAKAEGRWKEEEDEFSGR